MSRRIDAGDAKAATAIDLRRAFQRNTTPEWCGSVGGRGPPWSQLTAYDLNEGTILWQINNGSVNGIESENGGSHMPRGGPVATAGGLLFQGTSSDRTIRAYNQDNGEILWEYPMDAAVEGVPAVYRIDGRQYITFPVAAGNGSFGLRIGQPDPAPGQYVTFALPE